MRFKWWLLVSMLSPALTGAGWFGPSTRAECIEAYVVTAHTKSAARAAYAACDALFHSPPKHQVIRDRSQCVLDGIGTVEVDAMAGTLVRLCEDKYPPPPCPERMAFRFDLGACEWTCPGDLQYNREAHLCEWHCMAGMVADPTTYQCRFPTRAEVEARGRIPRP